MRLINNFRLNSSIKGINIEFMGWKIGNNGIEKEQIKNVICKDVLNLPVKKRFDIIHCSLFLHHLKHEELIKIISEVLQKRRCFRNFRPPDAVILLLNVNRPSGG